MNKTKTIDNKVAVSASRSATCWADAPDEDAERESFDLCEDCEDIVCMCSDKPLGYDDPTCCDECGGDLDVYEICNSCDV